MDYSNSLFWVVLVVSGVFLVLATLLNYNQFKANKEEQKFLDSLNNKDSNQKF